MRRFSLFIVAAILVAGTLTLTDDAAPADETQSVRADPKAPVPVPQTSVVAITGALLRTQTDAGDYVGTIVLDGGKIVAIGKDVVPPAGARVVDGNGHVITPGLIDAHGLLWLNPAAAKEGGGGGTLNILDAVDPYADDWREAAAQGVTAVYVQPASGTFAGNGAVLRVGPATSAETIPLKAIAGVQASVAGGQGGNALTRFAASEGLRGQLNGAKTYGDSKPAKPDAAKELMLKVVRKELPLRLEIANDDDVRNALKVAGDYGIRPTFERLDRVRSLPDGRYAAVLGPFPVGKTSNLRQRLVDGNKPFAFGTFGDDPKGTAGLRLVAAAAVAEGYPRDRVLRALTRGAAELLGVDDKLGTLAVGRVADLAAFAGDPLDASVPARLVVSQGVVVHDGFAQAEPASPHADVPELPATFPTSYVLKTKRLLADSGEYVPGELVVENGKLTAKSSANLPTIDVGDAVVTPGLVNAHASTATGVMADADASHVRATDGIGPDSANLKTFRTAGVLTVVAAPASETTIAGLSGVLKLSNDGAAVVGDVGQKFVLSATARNADRYPATLGGQVEFIAGRLSGTPSTTNYYLHDAIAAAMLAQRDKALEPVKQGRQSAVFDVQTPAELSAALRLIADHKLRGVLLTPRRVDGMAAEIKSARVGVIVGPMRATDPEYVRAGFVELGKLGVPLAFGTVSAPEQRASAAWLVNGGMGRHDARRALVGRAGPALGLPASTGRLAAGDSADFVVWDGCPLDPGSKPVAVVADGARVTK